MASGISSRGSHSEKPRRGRKTVARKLYDAAGVLPAEIRRELRAYLIEHGELEPRRRKVHSWKRKKSKRAKGRLVAPRSVDKSRPGRVDSQIPLPLD